MDFKYYFGAAMFCLILVMNTNAIHFKSRANFHEVVPCAMTGKSFIARIRIWERPCRPRRTLTVRDISEFASRERGPDRTELYNPTYGFEPYWEFGDWVFDKIKPKKNETNLCDGRCPRVYQSYGKICSVTKDFKYTTYESYCEMKNADCEDLEEHRMIYRGKCVPNLITIPTESDLVFTKVDGYIKNYYGRTPTTTISVKGWWFGRR